MEDFGIDLNNEIGTRVDSIKKYNNETDTDIDYDKILKNLNNDMNKEFVRDIEKDLIKPSNFKKSNLKKKENFVTYLENVAPVPDIEINKNSTSIIKKNSDLLISILLFLLLNNKIMIEFMYKLPIIKSLESPYPNLILRTLIFGIILYCLKKFNL